MGQEKPSANRKENNTGNASGNHQYQFESPRKLSEMKKAETNKYFFLTKPFRNFARQHQRK